MMMMMMMMMMTFVSPELFRPADTEHEGEIFCVIRQTRISRVVVEKPNSIEHNTRRPSLMGGFLLYIMVYHMRAY